MGTPVTAPFPCIVHSFRSDAGGLHLEMRPSSQASIADRVIIGVCHLSSVIPPEGYTAVEGEVVACTGDTGKTTGPHAHIYMKTLCSDGEWRYIDPTPALSLLVHN